jgi:uncharacterized protein YndB with AHSA1/START domain
LFDAPRALVWKAWTDPKHAMNWWGPASHPVRHLDMDVRVGGRWRNCLRSLETGEDLWQHGVFREVVPNERLVFTFQWEEDGERGLETLITITFADEGSRTRMTFQHAPFQSVEQRDSHNRGWSSMFDRLVGHLAQEQGGAP